MMGMTLINTGFKETERTKLQFSILLGRRGGSGMLVLFI